jgi:hypothetical protein
MYQRVVCSVVYAVYVVCDSRSLPTMPTLVCAGTLNDIPCSTGSVLDAYFSVTLRSVIAPSCGHECGGLLLYTIAGASCSMLQYSSRRSIEFTDISCYNAYMCMYS